MRWVVLEKLLGSRSVARSSPFVKSEVSLSFLTSNSIPNFKFGMRNSRFECQRLNFCSDRCKITGKIRFLQRIEAGVGNYFAIGGYVIIPAFYISWCNFAYKQFSDTSKSTLSLYILYLFIWNKENIIVLTFIWAINIELWAIMDRYSFSENDKNIKNKCLIQFFPRAWTDLCGRFLMENWIVIRQGSCNGFRQTVSGVRVGQERQEIHVVTTEHTTTDYIRWWKH